MRKIIIVLWLLISVLYCGLAWSQDCQTVNVSVLSEDGLGIEDAAVNCGTGYLQYTNKDGFTSCSNVDFGNEITASYPDGCYSSGKSNVPTPCTNGVRIVLTYNVSTGCGSLCPDLTVCNVASTIYEGTNVNLTWTALPIWHLANIKLLQDKIYLGKVVTWADEANDGAGTFKVPTVPTGYYWFVAEINGQRKKSNRFYIP
jgi:hypothetical protein